MNKKKTEKTMHDLALALCEGRNVWFNNHSIRFVTIEGEDNACLLCEMDSICNMEMVDLCGECESIKRKKGLLKLVLPE